MPSSPGTTSPLLWRWGCLVLPLRSTHAFLASLPKLGEQSGVAIGSLVVIRGWPGAYWRQGTSLPRGKGDISAARPASLMAHQSSLAAGIISRHGNLLGSYRFLCTNPRTFSLLGQTKVAEMQRRGADPKEGPGKLAQSCVFLSSQKPSLLGPVFVNDQLFP